MSRYRKTSPVPFIAAGVLLAGFAGLVVWATRGGDKGSSGGVLPAAPAPVARVEPEPMPAQPPPEPVPDVQLPPAPRFTAAQAEERLRQATAEWRAFTLELCKQQRWSQARAVAFLERTTWNDRDLEKQHAHGLASLRLMLGLDSEDPVALAEALAAKGDLHKWFAENWSKVDVEWKPENKVVELDDAWKPNRIRWGFPLDTPVEKLQEFKMLSTAALEAWQGLAGSYIGPLEIDETAKVAMWQSAIGDDLVTQELKMHAAFRVLLGKPEGTMREVVEEFFRLTNEKTGEELGAALADKLPAAVEAAGKAE